MQRGIDPECLPYAPFAFWTGCQLLPSLLVIWEYGRDSAALVQLKDWLAPSPSVIWVSVQWNIHDAKRYCGSHILTHSARTQFDADSRVMLVNSSTHLSGGCFASGEQTVPLCFGKSTITPAVADRSEGTHFLVKNRHIFWLKNNFLMKKMRTHFLVKKNGHIFWWSILTVWKLW